MFYPLLHPPLPKPRAPDQKCTSKRYCHEFSRSSHQQRPENNGVVLMPPTDVTASKGFGRLLMMARMEMD